MFRRGKIVSFLIKEKKGNKWTHPIKNPDGWWDARAAFGMRASEGCIKHIAL